MLVVAFVATVASKMGMCPLAAHNVVSVGIGVAGHFVVVFKAVEAAAKIALNVVNLDIGPQTVPTRASSRQGEVEAAAE